MDLGMEEEKRRRKGKGGERYGGHKGIMGGGMVRREL